MNTVPHTPTESFEPTRTWHVEDVQDAYLAETVKEMNDERPEALIHDLTQKVEQAGNGVRFAILNGGGSESSEYSTTDALVMLNPFANGATPNMLVRGEFVRRAAKKKDIRDDQGKLKPVIMVASPGIRGSNFKLTREERQQVRRGDLGPVAREMLLAITEKDFGTVALFGYSQGADVALAGVREAYGTDLDTTAVAVGDPAGVEGRGVAKLGADFMKAPDIKPSIERTGLDAQQEALGNGLAGMAEFAASGLHPLNRALIRGMGKNTFEFQMLSALAEGVADRLVVGYGENSAIAKPSEIEPALAHLHTLADLYAENTGTLISVKVDGANHTWGDQLPLLTKLYMRAVEE